MNEDDLSDLEEKDINKKRLEKEIEHINFKEQVINGNETMSMREEVKNLFEKIVYKDKIIQYCPDFEKSPLEKFVENIEIKGIEKEKWKEIQETLYDIVPSPDFSDKYSVIKYIYDYYIGNQRISVETSYTDASKRMEYLERIKNFNEFDDILKNYPFDKKKTESKYLQKIDELNLGKDLSVPSSEEMGNDNKLKMLNHQRYLNVVQKMINSGSFDEKTWTKKVDDKASIEIEETYMNYLVSYQYSQMVENYGHQYYEDVTRDYKAHTMLLTENSRNKNQTITNSNENLYKQKYNLSEIQEKTMGYGNLENRFDDKNENGYEDLMEEM